MYKMGLPFENLLEDLMTEEWVGFLLHNHVEIFKGIGVRDA